MSLSQKFFSPFVFSGLVELQQFFYIAGCCFESYFNTTDHEMISDDYKKIKMKPLHSEISQRKPS